MQCYIVVMHKIVLIIAASAVIGLLQVQDARACTCVPNPPPATALAESDAVFAGRIIELSRGTDPIAPIIAKFEVSRVWKGPVTEIVEVRTPRDSAACGLSFAPGTEWLVYADRVEGSLTASLCSRSTQMAYAAEDLAALGPGTPPNATPPTPPGAGGCACSLNATDGEAPWGALAMLAAAAVTRLRRRR